MSKSVLVENLTRAPIDFGRFPAGSIPGLEEDFHFKLGSLDDRGVVDADQPGIHVPAALWAACENHKIVSGAVENGTIRVVA